VASSEQRAPFGILWETGALFGILWHTLLRLEMDLAALDSRLQCYSAPVSRKQGPLSGILWAHLAEVGDDLAGPPLARSSPRR